MGDEIHSMVFTNIFIIFHLYILYVSSARISTGGVGVVGIVNKLKQKQLIVIVMHTYREGRKGPIMRQFGEPILVLLYFNYIWKIVIYFLNYLHSIIPLLKLLITFGRDGKMCWDSDDELNENMKLFIAFIHISFLMISEFFHYVVFPGKLYILIDFSLLCYLLNTLSSAMSSSVPHYAWKSLRSPIVHNLTRKSGANGSV